MVESKTNGIDTSNDYLLFFQKYSQTLGSDMGLLAKRTTDITWATYNVAWSDTQQEDEAAGNASEDKGNGPNADTVIDWIGNKPSNKYCMGMEWNANMREFIADELYFNSQGGADGECWDNLSGYN
mmetsp:Transcript_4021/g.3946  ORF Transcript_4021/g.3946 Transcript_4021/m.3946 type:complete len:126 (-) Transcript_4021:188-565(-)